MRRFVLASLEAFARRIGTDVKPAAGTAPPEPEPIERDAASAAAEPLAARRGDRRDRADADLIVARCHPYADIGSR